MRSGIGEADADRGFGRNTSVKISSRVGVKARAESGRNRENPNRHWRSAEFSRSFQTLKGKKKKFVFYLFINSFIGR